MREKRMRRGIVSNLANHSRYRWNGCHFRKVVENNIKLAAVI
jgi:hypothetical protein